MAFIYDLADTWNAGGTTFNAIKMNVTDSASAAASRLVSLQVGGSEQFSVRKDGQGYFAGNVGIGTSSPASFGGYTSLTVDNATNGGLIEARTNGGTRILRMQSQGSGSALVGTTTATSLGLMTGAVERVTLDTSGNVGIGTSSPAGKLDVNGSAYFPYQADAEVSFRFSNDYRFGLRNTAADPRKLRVFTQAADGDGQIIFATGNNVERMRIDSSGNVGIGVTPSASSEPLLQMPNGGMIATAGPYAHYMSNAHYSGGAWRYTTTAVATRYEQGIGIHSWHTAPSGTAGNVISFSERMRIDSSGNVGIGTASPSAAFHVFTGASPNAAQLMAGYLGGSENYYDANTHIFRNGAFSERMRITSAGDIGIGTSSPDAKLTVESTYGIVSVKSTVGSKKVVLGGDAFTDAFTGTTTSHNFSVIVGGNIVSTFTTGGNVGIGTSAPGSKLQVNGTGTAIARIVETSTTGYTGLNFANTGSQNYTLGMGGTSETAFGVANKFFLYDGVAGAMRMVVDTSGNVGIGTASPNAAARLDVSSTTSGFLPPRMTTAQRDAIASPPNGLMLYNTSTDKLQVRAAGAWVDLH